MHLEKKNPWKVDAGLGLAIAVADSSSQLQINGADLSIPRHTAYLPYVELKSAYAMSSGAYGRFLIGQNSQSVDGIPGANFTVKDQYELGAFVETPLSRTVNINLRGAYAGATHSAAATAIDFSENIEGFAVGLGIEAELYGMKVALGESYTAYDSKTQSKTKNYTTALGITYSF